MNGGVFGTGVAMRAGPLFGALGLDATLQQGESTESRYYTDTFSNGQSRCRDSETGQFVATEKCSNLNVDSTMGLTAEGALVPYGAFPLYLGGGAYRGGGDTAPYASIGYFGDVGEGKFLGHARVIFAEELWQARMAIAIPLGG